MRRVASSTALSHSSTVPSASGSGHARPWLPGHTLSGSGAAHGVSMAAFVHSRPHLTQRHARVSAALALAAALAASASSSSSLSPLSYSGGASGVGAMLSRTPFCPSLTSRPLLSRGWHTGHGIRRSASCLQSSHWHQKPRNRQSISRRERVERWRKAEWYEMVSTSSFAIAHDARTISLLPLRLLPSTSQLGHRQRWLHFEPCKWTALPTLWSEANEFWAKTHRARASRSGGMPTHAASCTTHHSAVLCASSTSSLSSSSKPSSPQHSVRKRFCSSSGAFANACARRSQSVSGASSPASSTALNRLRGSSRTDSRKGFSWRSSVPFSMALAATSVRPRSGWSTRVTALLT